jgi:hypothetical protein
VYGENGDPPLPVPDRSAPAMRSSTTSAYTFTPAAWQVRTMAENRARFPIR